MPLNSSPKTLLLVCNTRTGSTAFANGLAASNQGVVTAGEAFNPNMSEHEGAFFHWIARRKVSAIDFLSRKLEIAESYLAEMRAAIDAKLVVYDIKYHDMFNFLPVPALLDFPPVILKAVSDNNGSIVHLRRRNKFDSVISQMVAQETKVYHVNLTQPRTEIHSRIKTTLDEVLYQVKTRELQEAVICRMLSNSSCAFHDIYYEDIFGDTKASAMSELSLAIGMSLRLDVLLHRKIGVDYESAVEDYDALKGIASMRSTADWSFAEI